MSLRKHLEVMQMVADDAAKDAKEFDGKPFNGKTVAEYFGNQGAAIAAIAEAIQAILEDRLEHSA